MIHGKIAGFSVREREYQHFPIVGISFGVRLRFERQVQWVSHDRQLCLAMFNPLSCMHWTISMWIIDFSLSMFIVHLSHKQSKEARPMLDQTVAKYRFDFCFFSSLQFAWMVNKPCWNLYFENGFWVLFDMCETSRELNNKQQNSLFIDKKKGEREKPTPRHKTSSKRLNSTETLAFIHKFRINL